MNTYTPDQNKIVHYVNVDFATRNFIDTVHLVQYDDKLPILAVRMFQNGVNYDGSSASRIQLRYGKKDRTFVIADSLGVSDDGSTAYFMLTKQITVEAGEHITIIDVLYEASYQNAASSSFPIIVDKNPVTDDMVESLTEYKALVEYRDEAQASAAAAKESEINSKESELNSKESELNAKESEINSKESEVNSKESEVNSKDSEVNSKNSEIRSEQILDSMEQMIVGGLTYLLVDELPVDGQNSITLYLIPDQNGSAANRIAYIWKNNMWIKWASDNGLTYLQVDNLPDQGRDHMTIYLVPSKLTNVPNTFRDAYIWTASNQWILLSGQRGDTVLDTSVTISPEEWDTTRRVTKTVTGVTESNKVYAVNQSDKDVWCDSQGIDQLTFALDRYALMPDVEINFSILIINPTITS